MSQSAKYAYDFFISKGYSSEAASALVGNFEHESGFNTRAIHDQGTGFGIAGFRDEKKGKGRKTNLVNFAKQNGLDPGSLDTQLRFVDYELQTSEKDVGQKLKKARSVEDANNAVLDYERPQGWTKDRPQAGHGYSSRLAKARNVLASYTGQAVPAPSGADAGYDEWVEPNQEVADSSSEEATVPEEKSAPESRLRSGIKALIAGMGSSEEQAPFDYTPAGEGIDVAEYDVNQGAIPTDAYQNYVNFKQGGNVEKKINPHEFFRLISGGR